jgi:hypothetical protein
MIRNTQRPKKSSLRLHSSHDCSWSRQPCFLRHFIETRMQPQRDYSDRKEQVLLLSCSRAILHIFVFLAEKFLNLGLQSCSNNDIYRTDWLSTPLTFACGCRNGEPYPERLAIVKLLVKYNAEVNFRSVPNWTALRCAEEVNWGDVALMKYLNSIGAEHIDD